MPDVDGGLIGGAALVAEDFGDLARSRRAGLKGRGYGMHTLVIVLHVLAAVAIVVLVLLQHGKGADMGAAFGSGSAGSLSAPRAPPTSCRVPRASSRPSSS